MSDERLVKTARFMISEMMKERWFDVCIISDACDLLGVDCTFSKNHKTLRAVHCMHFDKMPVYTLELINENIELLLFTEKESRLTKLLKFIGVK